MQPVVFLQDNRPPFPRQSNYVRRKQFTRNASTIKIAIIKSEYLQRRGAQAHAITAISHYSSVAN